MRPPAYLWTGGTAKTMNYRFVFYFPEEGSRDFSRNAEVGTWVGKNAKVLDKKSATDCCKLIADEFPWLLWIDAIHHNGPVARWFV